MVTLLHTKSMVKSKGLCAVLFADYVSTCWHGAASAGVHVWLFCTQYFVESVSDLLVFPDASSARLCHFLCWTVLFSAIWSKMTAYCLHCATVLLKDISIRKFLRITRQSARNRKQNVCQLMEQDVHLSSGCVKISLKTWGHFKLLVCGSTLVSRALFKTTVPATSCE